MYKAALLIALLSRLLAISTSLSAVSCSRVFTPIQCLFCRAQPSPAQPSPAQPCHLLMAADLDNLIPY